MAKRNPKWFGLELDDDNNRASMLRSLKRSGTQRVVTPYWDCSFVNWLIYEGTIHPCGLSVASIEPDTVTLVAHCAGVQTQGICLDAVFKVPTRKFYTPDFVKMIGPYRYHKHGPACKFEWFPAMGDRRVAPDMIAELRWWYDSMYDESGKEDNG